MLATWGASKSLAARVRDIFAKYGTNAHMYLAGTEITQGFTPGNYVESTGITPATVDQPVGLVKDAANVTGGIDASQATSGFRPVERRGIVNLLTYSNDLTNAAWVKSNSSVSGNKLVADTSSGWHSLYGSYTASNDVKHTICYLLKKSEYKFARISDGTSGNFYASVDLDTGAISATGGVDFVSASAEVFADGSMLFAVVTTGRGVAKAYGVIGYPSTGATLGIYGAQYTGDNTSGIFVYARGLFSGTLTASQILSMGGIPLTTTAAASSAMGPYYLQFDGTDDRLTLGSVPFQMADDFCLTAAFRCEDISVTRHIVCATGGGGTQRISFYITPTTGQITAFFRDDAGNNTVKQVSGNYLNVAVVAQIVKRSGNVSIWVNGALSGTESALNPSIGTTTLTEFAIAGSAIVGNYFKGNIYECAPIKGTFTDADILLMAKSAAQIAGVTL